MSPVDRIHIYQKHRLDDTLLLDSYESLTTRDEPIAVEEGYRLGLPTCLHLARAREMSRGPDTGGGLRSPSAVQVHGPDLRSLLLDIFNLQTNGATYLGPFTAPVNPSDKLDRASALPAVSNAIYFDWEILKAISIALSRLHPQPHRSRGRYLKAHRHRRITLQRRTPST
jgi:hypothetical protein